VLGKDLRFKGWGKGREERWGRGNWHTGRGKCKKIQNKKIEEKKVIFMPSILFKCHCYFCIYF